MTTTTSVTLALLSALPPSDQQIIRRRGTNATLTFQVPTGSTSVWLKRLDNEKYIFYCRDGRSTRPSDQEESFKGRVEGTECGMINSTISVTVKNLTRNDSGTYEFHGVEHDGRRFNKTIFLNVTDRVETFTFPTLENPLVHISWFGIVVCILIGIIYGRCRKPKSSPSNSESCHDDEDDNTDAPGLISEKKTLFNQE